MDPETGSGGSSVQNASGSGNAENGSGRGSVEIGSGGGNVWRSPAGISALAAAAAVLVAVAGLIIQANASADRPPDVGGVTPGDPAGGGAGSSGGPTSESTESETASPSPTTSSEASDEVRIPAVCVGCTEAERTERQQHLNELTARLAAPHDEYCKDTTETFEPSDALARVGCTFNGGFSVDYTLWPDEDSMASFTEQFRGMADVVERQWSIAGEDAPSTGVTIEFIEDDTARFYWTYDEFSISGNAQYGNTDQETLNDWWRTFGTILRES